MVSRGYAPVFHSFSARPDACYGRGFCCRLDQGHCWFRHAYGHGVRVEFIPDPRVDPGRTYPANSRDKRATSFARRRNGRVFFNPALSGFSDRRGPHVGSQRAACHHDPQFGFVASDRWFGFGFLLVSGFGGSAGIEPAIRAYRGCCGRSCRFCWRYVRCLGSANCCLSDGFEHTQKGTDPHSGRYLWAWGSAVAGRSFGVRYLAGRNASVFCHSDPSCLGGDVGRHQVAGPNRSGQLSQGDPVCVVGGWTKPAATRPDGLMPQPRRLSAKRNAK